MKLELLLENSCRKDIKLSKKRGKNLSKLCKVTKDGVFIKAYTDLEIDIAF